MNRSFAALPIAVASHALSPSGRKKITQLSLTAVTMGVQAMAAFAQSNQEPALAKGGNKERVEFDIETLKSNGLDADLARYFAERSRFSPGMHQVSLVVNGVPHGLAQANFDKDGVLCYGPELIRRAGLKMPDVLQSKTVPVASDATGSERSQSDEQSQESEPAGEDSESAAANSEPIDPAQHPDYSGCFDYRDIEPRTETDLDPAKEEVRIVVPASALQQRSLGEGYSAGGVGAVLNYNMMGSTNQWKGQSSSFFFGSAEAGFNAGNWIVRSQQSYSIDQGQDKFELTTVYAQRTFAKYASMVQGGRIYIQNPLFAGVPIDGIQIQPDTALSPKASGPSYDGIAQSQARVEVRQSGLLIYSTVVPGGPFTLKNLPLIDSTADVEVTVVEADGQARRTVIAAASLATSLSAPQGLYAAIGRVRSDGDNEQPLVAAVSKGWAFGKKATASAGSMVTTKYQMVSMGYSASPFRGWNGGAQSQFTRANDWAGNTAYGASTTVSVDSTVSQSVSARVYASWYSKGFRSIYQTTFRVPTKAPQNPNEYLSQAYGGDFQQRSQLGASLSWGATGLGTLSVSYSRADVYSGAFSQRVTGTWNRQFGRVNANVYVEQDLRASKGGTSVYGSLSFPLGKASGRTYVSSSQNRTRFGVGANQVLNEYVSYNLDAERADQSGSERLSAGVSVLPRYAQTNLNATYTGNGSSAYSGQVQGGIVATRKGVTLSPYSVSDTFAVATAGDLAGVRIQTPQGIVWTDGRGKAVVPTLQPFAMSNVQIVTKSLPRNADVKNGFQEVGAGRGSVNFVDFGVTKVRRVLLDAKLSDGELLPSDSSIRNDKDEYVTTAIEDGKVFLDSIPDAPLHAQMLDGKRCTLEFAMPEKQNLDVPFEQVDAVCRPGE